MSEAFLALSADERREALAVAASASGRPAHLLEKDIWVVWALDALFSSPLGEHLAPRWRDLPWAAAANWR